MAIPKVRKKSLTCPYCLESVTKTKGLVRCRSCRTFQHRQCWESNGGHCSVYGCSGEGMIEYRGGFFRRPSSIRARPGLILFFSLMLAGIVVQSVTGSTLFARPIGGSALCVMGYLLVSAFADPTRDEMSRWLNDVSKELPLCGVHCLWILGLVLGLTGVVLLTTSLE